MHFCNVFMTKRTKNMPICHENITNSAGFSDVYWKATDAERYVQTPRCGFASQKQKPESLPAKKGSAFRKDNYMLQIFTRKNYLHKDKGNFVFMSRTSQIVNYEALIKRMIQYNSTITDSDIRSVLSVLFTILVRCAAQGCYVQTPIGSFWANASGTADTIDTPFEPKNTKNDHEIGMKFRFSLAAKAKLLEELEAERVSSEFVQRPSIMSVSLVDDKGKETQARSFSAGNTIKLHGSNLKIDPDDAEQGVAFSNDSVTVKAGKIRRNTPNSLEVEIPEGIAVGTYKVSVTTKPGRQRYASASAEDPVTIA